MSTMQRAGYPVSESYYCYKENSWRLVPSTDQDPRKRLLRQEHTRSCQKILAPGLSNLTICANICTSCLAPPFEPLRFCPSVSPPPNIAAPCLEVDWAPDCDRSVGISQWRPHQSFRSSAPSVRWERRLRHSSGHLLLSVLLVIVAPKAIFGSFAGFVWQPSCKSLGV